MFKMEEPKRKKVVNTGLGEGELSSLQCGSFDNQCYRNPVIEGQSVLS
jgi:hypothetical protein